MALWTQKWAEKKWLQVSVHYEAWSGGWDIGHTGLGLSIQTILHSGLPHFGDLHNRFTYTWLYLRTKYNTKCMEIHTWKASCCAVSILKALCGIKVEFQLNSSVWLSTIPDIPPRITTLSALQLCSTMSSFQQRRFKYSCPRLIRIIFPANSLELCCFVPKNTGLVRSWRKITELLET